MIIHRFLQAMGFDENFIFEQETLKKIKRAKEKMMILI